jgi:hypothetical protein
MKVKEITLAEDTYEVTTKPMPGATSIEVGGQSVGTAKDPQTAQTVAQAAKDGKLSLTPPGTPAGGNSSGQVQEEPATPGVSPVNTKTNPPTVMDNGNIKGSPLGVTKSGEEISPELIARSTDWQERKIQANGKTYTALYSGTRGYVVGRQTYQAITGSAQPVRESDDELARWKSIAGV